ncbi:MAG: NCS2 family permease [Methylobacteriaceae bacterium]|jgi:AGZA family xanthine/uracil permease-like MFS transporter|nr:NCS2 family permease [Methylobacteriaceae bacterium]
MDSLSRHLNRLFHLQENGATIRGEFIGGFTTFMAMAYVVLVVPDMLADAGMPRQAATTALILITAAVTAFMGVWAGYPVVVAPGLGISAFFAYYVCGTLHLPWQAALGAVFISGVVFLLLTVTRLRQMIIDAVPMDMKYATVVGIGMFIAFIGLKKCGIVVSHPQNFVALGNLTSTSTLLAVAGICAIGALVTRGVNSAIPLGIIGVTLIGMALGETPAPESLADIAGFAVPSPAPLIGALDIAAAVRYGLFSVIFTITVADLFDSIGTLIGLSRKAGLMDERGAIRNLDRALITDSAGVIASSVAGLPTVTVCLESASGIAAGGRTGLTAVFTALLFLMVLFFVPAVSLVPGYAAATAMVIVGAMMMRDVTRIRFDDFRVALPAFLTIVMMPLSFSIATGFGFGFISWVILHVLTGRAREVSPVMWGIAACFAVNFALRLG